MVFSSTIFLFGFLPLVLLGYFVLPKALRNSWLLTTSLLFYAWGEPRLVIVMLISIAWNYAFGLLVGRYRESRWGGVHLAVAVAGNLGLLCWFKYIGFLTEAVNQLFAAVGLPALAPPGIVLPIGISFYTFQAMSYVIDVYRQEVPPQRDPLALGLYVALFPQLIAGPIVRYRDVAEQLSQRQVTPQGFASGIERFVTGLAKKVLLANILASVADAVFTLPASELTTAVAWLGLVAYTLQIYYDFSGYSDMAIGLGRMFGFQFVENFDYPYSAASVTEFWRRWHISLSTWFRDYLYIPLGGNRCGAFVTYRNLSIVFVLCGLWHGASVSFLLWGAMHGLFLILERAGGQQVLARVPRIFRHAYTLFAVMMAWVLFRVDNLSHAAAFYTVLFGVQSAVETSMPLASLLDRSLMILLGVAMLLAVPWWRGLPSPAKSATAASTGNLAAGDSAAAAGSSPTAATPLALGWLRFGWQTGVDLASYSALMSLLILSAMRLFAQTHNPFIYFRF